MTNTSARRDPLRYRAYYWLMDACLLVIVLGILEMAVYITSGLSTSDLPSPFDVIVRAPLIVFCYLVPLFLILARFMRDDYAEDLWRRTAAVFAYLVAILPIMIAIPAWLGYLLIPAGTALAADFNATIALLLTEVPVAIAIQVFLAALLVCFVVIFQFLRWRDSR